MDVRIKANDLEMTQEVSAYLDERLASIEKILGDDALAARLEVEIVRDGGNQRHGDNMWKAEMNIMYPGGPRIRATNHAATVNAAIDDVKEEATRQIRSERQAHRRVIRRTGAAIKRLMRFGNDG